MSIRHPATITQFRYFPLVLDYIHKAANHISFIELQQNLIRKNYELQAQYYNNPFKNSDSPKSPSQTEKGGMYDQLRQILNELISFGLVEVKDRKHNSSVLMIPYQLSKKNEKVKDWVCSLTPLGYEMWQLIETRNSLEFKARYFYLMFTRFRVVPKFLQAVYNQGKNSVVLPHVTAQQLGLGREIDLENREYLAFYLDEVSKSVLSTYADEVKNPSQEVIANFKFRLPNLQQNILKATQEYHAKDKRYPRFLIIARIRDYCVSYFAHVLVRDNTISGRSLEALSSRLSRMEIMGYSDYIQHGGRLLFLCSWVTPFLKSPFTQQNQNFQKFCFEAFRADNKQASLFEEQSLIFHQPQYQLIKGQFEDSLEKAFNKFYYRQHKQFVSIPDVRETVCFDLKISAKTFDKLMTEVYKDSFNRQSRLEITLSSDPSYVEYGLERWHRDPLYLDGIQMTIVKIKRRIYDNAQQISTW